MPSDYREATTSFVVHSTDDLAPYRAELAGMDREQADAQVKRCRIDVAVFELVTKANGADWTGLTSLLVRLRLAERRLLALGGPQERVCPKTRQKRNQNTKR